MTAKNTHPDNKLWGDGWGWSWFDAGNPTKTTRQTSNRIVLAVMCRRKRLSGFMSMGIHH
jgi:hypothetical protein